MSKTRIVAAILDTANLRLYKEDGSTIEIPQGDTRIQRIIDESTVPLTTDGFYDIDLGYEGEQGNVYKDFEEKSSGIVKLFRIAKRYVQHIFDPKTDAEHVAPIALGKVPVVPATVAASGELVVAVPPVAPAPPVGAPTTEQVRDATQNKKMPVQEATAQIMKHARPVSDESFSSRDHNSQEDTMIAVVETSKGPAIIPNVENLEGQMRLAAKLGSTKGVENFLRRLGEVIDERGHSVKELLNFMLKGDLPIADDGCIIGYKVLRSTQKAPDPEYPVPKAGYYVDCHSGKVLQRIGSYVSQKNVDPSRRTQCSTGLHIARRNYLRNFPGDIITLVKIAPEDVIAVPEGEPDKMRARGYHILAEIPKSEHQRLRDNQPVEGMEAKKLLGMAIAGDHIDIIEDVVIGGGYGSNITVTRRKGALVKKAPGITEASPVAETIADPAKRDGAAKVDAKAIASTVTATKTGAPGTIGTMSQEEVTKQEEVVSAITPLVEAVPETEEPTPAPAPAPEPVKVNQAPTSPIRQLFNEGNYAKVVELQKAKKKSFAALGFSDAEIVQIKANPTQTQTAAQANTPKPQESKTATVKKTKGKPAHGQSVETKKVEETHSKTLTQQERIGDLLRRININSDADAKAAYQELIALKKAAKKSWMVLGVSNFEALQAKFEK